MLVAALPVVAGGAPEYDPFAVDQDHLQGAPDFGFLNAPLTAADRVVARDGHFYRVGDDLQPGTADDSRVRFFGVNLVAGANFPTVEDAGRLARRLRHLGLNLVRLHSLDGLPGPDPEHPESLLSDGPYPSLNPIAVVRLRQLIDALGSEGLYVAIDLHASYPFQPAIDGLPGVTDGAAWPDAGKPLNSFYPRILDLQDSYVRAVFDALHMRDDPALAMVEVSNEGSLLWAWQTRQLDRLVVGPYRAELQSQWDAFLRQQYGDTATTSAAWGGATGPGPELLPSRWIADGRVDMQSRDNVLTLRFPPAIGPVIVRQAGFSLDAGAMYVAEVQARAEAGAGQPIQWEVKEDQAPWRVLASQTIEPTPDWTAYRLSFEAPFALDGSGRFSVTGTGGAVQLRGWSVRMLPTAGLAPGEQLEAGTVRLPGVDETPTGPRADDLLRFLVDRDRAYARRIRATARATTRSDLPVTGTQMYYGGLLNLDAQVGMDYRDNHLYSDHYTFDRVAWDPYDWSIADVSSVGSGLASFVATAGAREAGYPYVVSEFNQPWPNQFGMEIDPTLAAFASFQDWDGLVHFAYEQDGSRGLDAGIPAGFNLDADWAKLVNIGQAAWLFRTGAVRAGTVPVDVPVTEATRLLAGRDARNRGITEQLQLMLGLDPAFALAHPVRLVPQDSPGAPPGVRDGDAAVTVSDTNELAYHRRERMLTIAAPLAAGIFGFLSGTSMDAGPLTVERVVDETGFAAVLVTSLDGQPVDASRRLLLTNPGPVLRSQPGTAPPRPQRLAPYAGGSRWTLEPTDPGRPSGNRIDGVAPTWMERVDTLLTLRSTVPNLQVFPLDHAGARVAPLGADDVQHIDGGYRLHLHAPGVPWYELATNSN